MKRILSLLLMTLTLCGALCAAAAEEILYTGTTTRELSIRAEKSTSAKKLGSVAEGETVHIIEYGGDWAKVDKDGVVGYILSKYVVDMMAAGPFDDTAEALFRGVSDMELSVRAKQDKSAPRLQSIAEGETVYITELGKEWHGVVKNGVRGYVLASHVKGLESMIEGVEVPEEYATPPIFEAVYTATATVNLSIRQAKDENSKLLGTLYQDDEVEVMETDGEWAYVSDGRATGYVRAQFLRYFERHDPFGPYVPGTVWYPYAARATQDVDIYSNETGELLRTVPAGGIMAVSALDENMAVTLPYDRITGRIVATGSLEFEEVKMWAEAQSGDLIAVFSTYYDPAQETQTQIGRLHNIMQGVTRLQNLVVPAGERFNFNDYCAPYTKSNGYQEGPIINYTSNKKLGYGGGICQVSTTLYNAILQIPIEVLLHYVHSSYGIDYAPLDFDAAVGDGNIDLRLRNALPYDVRFALQAEGGVLTVRVYRAS